MGGRWLSGQKRQTVNLLVSTDVGSNPTLLNMAKRALKKHMSKMLKAKFELMKQNMKYIDINNNIDISKVINDKDDINTMMNNSYISNNIINDNHINIMNNNVDIMNNNNDMIDGDIDIVDTNRYIMCNYI